MASKNSLNKFYLGYALSYFLIIFGNIALFGNISTKLFLAGADLVDIILYFGFVSVFGLILAFLAPILGYISDKREQGSRRRPYLIFSIVGMALMAVLYYISPFNTGFPDLFLNISFFVILHCIYSFSTMIFYISFHSLYPEMFQNLDSRSKVIGLLLGFSALASIIIVLLEAFFNVEEIYFGIIFGLSIILGGILLFKKGIDEPYLRLSEKPKINEPSSYKILSSSNKLFIWFLIAFIFITISESLISSSLNYNWLANLITIPPPLLEIVTFFMNIVPSVSIIAFLLYWRKLSLSIGIKKLLKILMLALLSLTVAIIFLSDLISGFILASLIKIILSGLSFVKWLFLAIIIDHYYLKTGKRREATYYGLNDSFNFISGYIGIILGSLSTVFSVPFVSPFDEIQIFYFFSKIGLSLIALIFIGISLIIIIRKIPLDRDKYTAIEKEIAEKNT
jgi:Na+/melibiose symporter-like transporter